MGRHDWRACGFSVRWVAFWGSPSLPDVIVWRRSREAAQAFIRRRRRLQLRLVGNLRGCRSGYAEIAVHHESW